MADVFISHKVRCRPRPSARHASRAAGLEVWWDEGRSPPPRGVPRSRDAVLSRRQNASLRCG